MATAKMERSTPSAGSRTNPATSDPSAAPSVLTSVSIPAASTSDPSLLRSAEPTSGKKMPDSSDTGSISGRLTRRIAAGSVIEDRPNGAMADGNAAYEPTVATAARKATSAANRAASANRIQSDAIKPPSAMPASTMPSITGNA